MPDLPTRADADGVVAHLPASHLPYRGPERRGATVALWRWLSAALDEIDYGIVLIGADGLARHVHQVARVHRLTTGEARVLRALCARARPAAIAAEHGVALSTVRTQIGSIRLKTGAESIRALLAQLARLPPLMGRLRSAPDRLPPLLRGMVLG